MPRRRITVVAVVLLLALSGCSSGDGDSESDGSPRPGDEETTGGDGVNIGMDPNFDVASLPDDFPSGLMPDSFTAGLYTELGDTRTVAFESSSGFDDVVAAYTDSFGEEPTIAEGEERLAMWVVDAWAVTVIDATPTLIGISTAG